jgi:16S rRNA G527 N7-methylase RsmG
MFTSNEAFEEALLKLETAFGETLTPDERRDLSAFVSFVEERNALIDLTAAKGADQLVEVFCADAMVLRDRAFVPEGANVLDLGTGAGGPAIAFLILRPDVHAVLLEPLKKRTTFLREAVEKLPSLAGRVEVRDGRIDTSKPVVGAGPFGPFDTAMARATFAPPAWLKIGKKLAPNVVVFLARESVETMPAPKAERRYVLPRTGAPRSIRSYRAR